MFILLLILSPVILIFVGLPLMAVIAVQKRLCRRNSKWVGLILPAAALVYGLFLTVNTQCPPERPPPMSPLRRIYRYPIFRTRSTL